MAKANKEAASALLEAHVKFELAGFKGAKLRKFAEREVQELFRQADELTLNHISSVDRVMAAIQRVFVEADVGSNLSGVAADLAGAVLQAPAQSETRLKDILTREQAVTLLEQALKFQRQREKLIRKVMDNPVYQELVADLVYNGLVNYLQDENGISRAVPQVGSILEFGKRMANRASPGLEQRIERRIKDWLADRLPVLIGRSERFLNEALSHEELHEAVMAGWDQIENRTLAELKQGTEGLELDELVVVSRDFWAHFRTTDYFRGCCRAAVERMFEQYGEMSLAALLDKLGVTETMVMTEVEANLLPIADVLRDQGYLEALLRRRLEPFYRSAAVTRILRQEEGE